MEESYIIANHNTFTDDYAKRVRQAKILAYPCFGADVSMSCRCEGSALETG